MQANPHLFQYSPKESPMMATVEPELESSIIFINKIQAGQVQLVRKSWVSLKKANKLFLKDLIKIKTNIGVKSLRIATKLPV